MPVRARGVVVDGLIALLCAGLVSGCSGGAVDIATPDLSATDASTCQSFVADLPDALAEQSPVGISPTDAPGAAYGDPAITVTCGVEVPADYFPGAICQQADGVGWFVPDEDYNNQDADVTMTAVGFRPVVQVQVPHDYRPEGLAAVFSELAPIVKKDLRRQMRCR